MGKNLLVALLAALFLVAMPFSPLSGMAQDNDGQLIAMSTLSPGRFPMRPQSARSTRKKPKAKASSSITASRKAAGKSPISPRSNVAKRVANKPNRLV
jgi:hypothetical protein